MSHSAPTAVQSGIDATSASDFGARKPRRFQITAPDGRSVVVEGDSAPTDQDAEQIFSQLPAKAKAEPTQSFAEDKGNRLARGVFSSVYEAGDVIDRGLDVVRRPFDRLTKGADEAQKLQEARDKERRENNAQFRSKAQSLPDPARDTEITSVVTDVGSRVAPALAGGGVTGAAALGGLMAGGAAASEAEAKGLPDSEVNKRALVNTLVGTVVNLIPIPGAGRISQIESTLLRKGAAAASGAATNMAAEGVVQAVEGELSPDRLKLAGGIGGVIGALFGPKFSRQIVGKSKEEVEVAVRDAVEKMGPDELTEFQRKLDDVLKVNPSGKDAAESAAVLSQDNPPVVKSARESAETLAQTPAPNMASVVVDNAAPRPSTAQEAAAVFEGVPTPKSAKESAEAITQKIDRFNEVRETSVKRAQAELAAEEVANPRLPAMSPQAERMYAQYGHIAPEVMNSLAGSAAGAAIGSTQGDNLEERVRNAATFGLAGAGFAGLSTVVARRLANKPIAQQIAAVREVIAEVPSPEVKAELTEVVEALTSRQRLTAKYPELANVPDGQIPVEIKGADGMTYGAIFNGFYDLGDRQIASIGRMKDGAGWSHGALNEGEVLLTKVPTPQQWFAGIREVADNPLPENARITIAEMGGRRAIQVDIPGNGDRPLFSGSPEDAVAAGYDVVIPVALPEGRYKYGSIVDRYINRQAGMAAPRVLMPLASSGVGAAYGLSQGDTPQERAANAFKFGLLGLGAGSVASRFVVRDPDAFSKFVAESAQGTEQMPNWYLKFRDTKPILRLRELVFGPTARIKSETASLPRGTAIPDENNPYLNARNYPGVVSARIKQEAETAAQALSQNRDTALDSLAKARGETYDALADRLNRFMAARTAKHYNRAHADYTAQTGKPASGMSDAEADAIVAQVRADGLEVVFEDLRQQVRQINDAALELRVRDGLISPADAARLRQTYPEHVPLNRVLEDGDEHSAMTALFGVPRFNVRASGIKSGSGSELPIDDIGTSVLTNLRDAIIRGERNRVGQSALNFYRQFPSKDVDVIKPKIIGRAGDLPVYAQPDDSTLVVREAGKPVWLRFKDPMLARAINGLGEEKSGMLLRGLGVITRTLAGLYTRFRPSFQVGNKIRDAQEAFTNLATSGDFKEAGKIATRSFSDMKAVAEAELGLNTPGAQRYREAEVDGAFSGGLASSMRGDAKQDLASFSPRRNPVLKAKDWAISAVDSINAIAEDSTRLAAYTRARANGATRQQAALIARDSSLDFALKGTLTKQVGSLYAFVGPGAQGAVKGIKNAIRNPAVIAEVGAGLLGLGMAVDAWNKSIDPDWKRKRQMDFYRAHSIPLILADDADGHYVLNIPLAQSLRPLKGAVDLLIDASSGDLGDVDAAVKRLSQIGVDAMNPVGGENIRQFAVPTMADPAVDMWANQTGTGSKIRPEKRNAEEPSYAQIFPRTWDSATGQAALAVAKKLSRFGIEVSPEDLLYSVKGYLGGPGEAALQTVNAADAMATPGKSVGPATLPVVSTFLKYVRNDAPLTPTAVDPSLRDAINQQAEERQELRGQAYRLMNEILAMPVAQRTERVRIAVQKNPTILDALADEAERRLKRTADEEMRIIGALGVQNGKRARYLFEKISQVPVQGRTEYVRQLMQAGVLTDEVLEQLAPLIGESQQN